MPTLVKSTNFVSFLSRHPTGPASAFARSLCQNPFRTSGLTPPQANTSRAAQTLRWTSVPASHTHTRTTSIHNLRDESELL